MPIQLPNDVVSVGYKEVRPFHHEQVFQSDSAGFTGTEQEFVAAGHGYEYVQIDAYTRRVVSAPKAVAGASSSLESAFGVSEDDVFLAVSRHGADITTADADALYAVLDAEDRRRIARSALDAGVDLDVQTLVSGVCTENPDDYAFLSRSFPVRFPVTVPTAVTPDGRIYPMVLAQFDEIFRGR